MNLEKESKINYIYLLNLNGEINKYDVSEFERKTEDKMDQIHKNKFVQNNEPILNNNNQNDFPI